MADQTLSRLYEVGNNIKRALAMKDKTQVWLSEKMTEKAHKEGQTDKRYGRAHINKWCTNRNIPTMQNMEWIADIVGLTVEELISGKFGEHAKSSSSLDLANDPIIQKEVDGIIKVVESACEENSISADQTNRYKALVQSKVSTIIDYIAG